MGGSGEPERLVTRIESMRDEIVEHVASLVRIPSVNPHYAGVAYEDVLGGEGDAVRYMAGIYGELDATVDVFGSVPGRETAVGRIAGVGPRGRSLIFNGHIDVVPGGDPGACPKDDPFSGHVNESEIWGRGATDMKGGVVAQAMAAAALKREGIRLAGDLFLEAVAGEETMDLDVGTTATIDRGYVADAAVVAEPTGFGGPLGIGAASPGNLWFSISIEGRPGHASMRRELVRADGGGDAFAVNAIEKALPVITALRDLEERWGATKRHSMFPPGQFVIHPGALMGGPGGAQVPFVIADECTIEYATWYPPDQPADSIRDEIADCIATCAAQDPWLRTHPPKVEWKMDWPAFELPVGAPILETLAHAQRSVTSADPSVSAIPYMCDASFLAAAGIPTVVHGPGELLYMHADGERVAIEQVVEAAKTFALTALAWCGHAPGGGA